jgi:hypothetical protein
VDWTQSRVDGEGLNRVFQATRIGLMYFLNQLRFEEEGCFLMRNQLENKLALKEEYWVIYCLTYRIPFI